MSFSNWHPAKKYKWVTIPIYMFKDMLIARRENEKDNVILVTGSRGEGKLQSLDSKVLTPNGWKKIGDLKVGDEIFSGNGKITKVTKLHQIGKFDLYKVKTRDGREALFNDEHLFNVINLHKFKDKKVHTISLKEIMKNYKSDRFDKRYNKELIEYHYQIPNNKPLEYEEKELIITPYVLGIWLGDGTSANGDITTNDKEVFNYFNYQIVKNKAKYRYCCYGLKVDLRKYDLIKNKHIPEIYLRGSIKQRIALLQGLIDSDGYISKRGNEIEFSNKNERIIDGVVDLVKSLGGNATKHKRKTKYNGKLFDSFRLNIRLPKEIIPVRLKRRLDRWKGSHKNEQLTNFITEIEYVKNDYGRCISVNEDGTYITDNYLLTHNSTFAGKILFQFPDFDPFESIVYTREAFFKQLKKKFNFIWADEGVVMSAKGNVMTRANKMLFESLTINRDNFNIIFFLLPFVEDFDSKILQYCSAWVHVDSRGLGVLMLPSNKGLFGKRNWDLDAMKKLFDEFNKENKKAHHMPYWVYPNFRGYIKFGKLTVDQDTIVKEIKTLRKNENLDKQTQEEVVIEVKELTNYQKHTNLKLAEMVMKGEIRDIEVFKLQCADLKVDFETTINKCDSILKRNNTGKTVRAILKGYEKEDSLIKF